MKESSHHGEVAEIETILASIFITVVDSILLQYQAGEERSGQLLETFQKSNKKMPTNNSYLLVAISTKNYITLYSYNHSVTQNLSQNPGFFAKTNHSLFSFTNCNLVPPDRFGLCRPSTTLSFPFLAQSGAPNDSSTS